MYGTGVTIKINLKRVRVWWFTSCFRWNVTSLAEGHWTRGVWRLWGWKTIHQEWSMLRSSWVLQQLIEHSGPGPQTKIMCFKMETWQCVSLVKGWVFAQIFQEADESIKEGVQCIHLSLHLLQDGQVITHDRVAGWSNERQRDQPLPTWVEG